MQERALADLPPEILWRVAGRLAAVDLEALGATCSTMRAVARDDPVWGTLFKRDYGAIYATGTPTMAWPHGDPTDHAWTDEAERLCGPAGEMPPRPTNRAWEPEPFARLRAAGKDGRWLYVAHARPLVAKRACAPDLRRPGNERNSDRSGVVAAGRIDYRRRSPEGADLRYHGDAIIGPDGALKVHGYGVRVTCSNGAVVSWCEAAWSNNLLAGWVVTVNERAAVARAAPLGHTQSRYIMVRANGSRAWDTVVNGRTCGWRLAINAVGSRSEAFYADGRCQCARVIDAAGALTEYGCDGTERAHGVGTVRYANGDRSLHRWKNGQHEAVLEFAFSLRCPDPAVAGRVVTARDWSYKALKLSDDVVYHALVPLDDSADCRLLRRYIAEGRTGWPRTLIDIAQRMMREHGLGEGLL
jgi:hypothetical protein